MYVCVLVRAHARYVFAYIYWCMEVCLNMCQWLLSGVLGVQVRVPMCVPMRVCTNVPAYGFWSEGHTTVPDRFFKDSQWREHSRMNPLKWEQGGREKKKKIFFKSSGNKISKNAIKMTDKRFALACGLAEAFLHTSAFCPQETK